MNLKKGVFTLFYLALFVTTAPLFALTSRPADHQILPEVIWAAASGGGTWVTEVQILASESDVTVHGYFYYGTGSRHITNIANIPEDTKVFFPNILAHLQSVDPSFNYYGKVGTLWLYVQDPANDRILATARTINGNYGKTYPGLNWVDDNCVLLYQSKLILDMRFTSTYRTFVGCFNAISGGYSLTAEFYLVGGDGYLLGSVFTKTFAPWEFKSFNPFVEAGLPAPSSSYQNVHLHIRVTSTTSPNPSRGLIVFASSANNTTNDTYAHFPVNAY